ncbi:YceI family protein [Aureisphaera galaxeae]|uniref:YceI family protein n=1 Tax=Aureisphaera galaxeae TaxID=1538023 RepID=UPI002350604A|nr:YceI family protein [Aureisphaera galaxeae]MDC8002971.1 YceI family protein [Aureisphaera galaxeae]
MKKFILLLLLSSTAQAQTFQITDSQTLTWQGKAAVGGYTPEGTLEIESASFSITNETIEALTVTIDMNTLEQENTQLRNHLRDKDFFHIAEYPTATFQLSNASKIVEGKALLTGKMTIRGITQTETIEAAIEQMGDQIFLTFEHTMDRTDYDVIYNSPSFFKKLKDQAIADDFVLKGKLVFK